METILQNKEWLEKCARDITLYGTPPKNTRRVERTLKLIAYLNNEWRTHNECAKHIDVSSRSIFRYLLMLTAFGFKVQRAGGRQIYRVINADRYFKNEGKKKEVVTK